MENAISTALIIAGSLIVAATFVLFGKTMKAQVAALQTSIVSQLTGAQAELGN